MIWRATRVVFRLKFKQIVSSKSEFQTVRYLKIKLRFHTVVTLITGFWVQTKIPISKWKLKVALFRKTKSLIAVKQLLVFDNGKCYVFRRDSLFHCIQANSKNNVDEFGDSFHDRLASSTSRSAPTNRITKAACDRTASERIGQRFQAERMPSCWHNFALDTATYYGHTDTSSTLWSIRHARSVAKASIPWNTGSRNVLHWQLPGYISLCPLMYLWTSSLSQTSQVRRAGKEVSEPSLACMPRTTTTAPVCREAASRCSWCACEVLRGCNSSNVPK